MTDEAIMDAYQKGLKAIINEAYDNVYTTPKNNPHQSGDETVALEKINKALGISSNL